MSHILRVQCAATTRGCSSAFTTEVDTIDDQPDARTRRVLALNGWWLDHGRWVCGAHTVTHIATRLADEWRQRYPELAKTHRPILEEILVGKWAVVGCEPIPGAVIVRGRTEEHGEIQPPAGPSIRLGNIDPTIEHYHRRHWQPPRLELPDIPRLEFPPLFPPTPSIPRPTPARPFLVELAQLIDDLGAALRKRLGYTREDR